MKYLLLIAVLLGGFWAYYIYTNSPTLFIYINQCVPTTVSQTGWTLENVYDNRGIIVDTKTHLYTKTKYVCKDGIHWL